MFIRSKTHPYGRMLSIEMVRLLILSLYVLYPLGCLLQVLPLSGATETWLSIAGLGNLNFWNRSFTEEFLT